MEVQDIINKGISAGYNVDLARKYGINEAIILNRLVFLHRHTQRKDGFTWQTAKDWEEYTGLSGYQVKRALDHLANEGILEVKNTYIIGTQVKCRHQRFILQSDYKETALPDYKETAQSESKETAQSVNSIEHNIERSIERKKERNYDDIFNEKQVDGKLKDAFVELIKSRKLNGNKMTDRALELAIDKVRRLSNSETTQIMIVNQSIEMGWKGVFPLKEENKVNSLEKVDPTYCSDECMEMFNYWGKIIGMRPQQNISNVEAMETMLKENGADQVQKMIIALRMRSEHGYLTKEIRGVSTPADLLNSREIIWGFYTKNENTWREWAENARQGKKKWEL